MKTIAIAIAGLLAGVGPAAFAQPDPAYQAQTWNGAYGQPAGQPGAGYPAPAYSDQGDPDPARAPSWRQDEPEDQNMCEAERYDQAEDAYTRQMREYRRQRREYERQRAAYDAQFGAGGSGAYAPPPPEPPAPPAAENGWRQDAWRQDGSPQDGPGQYGGSWRYSQTVPFRDGPWTADRGADWYRDHGCRLATPDGDGDQTIPVCPDSEGRYRPAG